MKDNLTEFDKVEVSDASMVVYLSEVRYKISLLSIQFFNAVEHESRPLSLIRRRLFGERLSCVDGSPAYTQATLGKPSIHTFP